MKLRFSLKEFLGLVAILALFCYWRSRPAQIAAKFQQAINRSDFPSADALLDEQSPWTLQQWQVEYGATNARFARDDQSIWDWLSGDCRGTIHVQLSNDPAATIEVAAPVVITNSGVHSPRVTLDRLDEEITISGLR